jgi:hypothetical protein
MKKIKLKKCKYCENICSENYIVCKNRQCQNIACYEDRQQQLKKDNPYFIERIKYSPNNKDEIIDICIDRI